MWKEEFMVVDFQVLIGSAQVLWGTFLQSHFLCPPRQAGVLSQVKSWPSAL